MFKKAAVLLSCSFLLAACAITPHDVEMEAEVPDSESRLGQDQKLGLRVLDNRPSARVGQRGHMNLGASITADNAAENLEDELRSFYTSLGFQVVDYNDKSADSKLEAALRGLELFVESNFPIGTTSNVNVVIRADAESSSESYAEVYRFSSEEKSFAAPTGDSITDYLNKGLSDVLAQMTTDEDLREVLVSK